MPINKSHLREAFKAVAYGVALGIGLNGALYLTNSHIIFEKTVVVQPEKGCIRIENAGARP